MKNIFTVCGVILSGLPWMWIFLCYLAYTVASSAPTPWHARCIYFIIFLALVLSMDVRDYVKNVTDSLKDRK